MLSVSYLLFAWFIIMQETQQKIEQLLEEASRARSTAQQGNELVEHVIVI